MKRPLRTLAAVASALAGVLAAAVAEAAPPKRPIPDYDGRGTPAKTAADVALVPARIVLFPFWFTSEYVLRRPLGGLVRTAEEKKWAAAIFDLFALDPAQKVHIYPSLLLDFGLLPSAGFYLSWADAFVPKNDVRLHMATWGPKWLTATIADRAEGRARRVRLAGGLIVLPRGMAIGFEGKRCGRKRILRILRHKATIRDAGSHPVAQIVQSICRREQVQSARDLQQMLLHGPAAGRDWRRAMICGSCVTSASDKPRGTRCLTLAYTGLKKPLKRYITTERRMTPTRIW